MRKTRTRSELFNVLMDREGFDHGYMFEEFYDRGSISFLEDFPQPSRHWCFSHSGLSWAGWPGCSLPLILKMGPSWLLVHGVIVKKLQLTRQRSTPSKMQSRTPNPTFGLLGNRFDGLDSKPHGARKLKAGKPEFRSCALYIFAMLWIFIGTSHSDSFNSFFISVSE